MTRAPATGDPCLAEAVESLLDDPKGHTVALSKNGDGASVRLGSSSGIFAFTFDRVAVDGSRFTTEGIGGYYRWEPLHLLEGFRCSDGTAVGLLSFGQDISGTIAGDAIRGTWTASWFDSLEDHANVFTTAHFAGSRR